MLRFKVEVSVLNLRQENAYGIMMVMVLRNRGFTIVELLIVIVVIGILAAIVIVSFNGIQERARDTSLKSDIKNVRTIVENYAAFNNGVYPSTGSINTVRTDANCYGGSAQADWVPSVPEKLPQSIPNTNKGRGNTTGCYMYASDGTVYIVSAWNMSNTGPSTKDSGMYRRLGFRETSFINSNAYLCNHTTIGGQNGSGGYAATSDYYKYSYTLSNITSCVETPPAGA